MEFEEVIASVDRYIEEQHTYFVLENLDTLRKNGKTDRTEIAGGECPEYQARSWGRTRKVRSVSLDREEA